MSRKLSFVALLFLMVPVLSAQATKQSPKPAPPKPAQATELKWGPAPDVFPAGAQLAVVSGDPGKPGKFVIQLQMPDGYKISPHFHPTAETVELKKGDFLVGMGDKFDATKLKSLGAKGQMPAKMHHFAAAKGATIVQITAQGPFALTYVNPADNPVKK